MSDDTPDEVSASTSTDLAFVEDIGRWTAFAPTLPTDNAAEFIARIYRDGDDRFRRLIYTEGVFYRWNGRHWQVLEREILESQVSEIFRSAWYVNGDGETVAFTVNNSVLDNLMRAIRNQVILPETPRFNTWLTEGTNLPDPTNLVSLNNCLLDVSTRTILRHTPRFFSVHAAPFDYVPGAEAPFTIAWLNEALEEDEQRVELALEWVGYILTNDISKQKMLSAIGPPGAGKGTYIRLCQDMVGEPNFAAPDMVSLGGSFGLEHAASKQLITIGDIQTLGRNAAESLSRLVAITGADEVEVNVKNKSSYVTKLPGRIMTASNRVPSLPDRDGALQRRMLVLKYRKSFTHKQDSSIEDRIHEELPGVLNVALDALDRMRERGNFVQPEIGKEELADLAAGAAPELEFAEECCYFDVEARVAKDELFEAWSAWTRLYGYERRKITGLIRGLRSKHPQLDARQKTETDGGERRPAVKGLGLTDEARRRFLAAIPDWRP